MVLLEFRNDFVKTLIIDHVGYWGLTLLCMLPMFAFIGYVCIHDALQAKKHH